MVDKVKYEMILEPLYEYISRQDLSDDILISYPIPAVYDEILVDMFFTYRRLLNNHIIKIDEVLIINPYSKALIAKFETNYEAPYNAAASKLTYSKYFKLRQLYIDLYEEIRPFAFEAKINEGQANLIKMFLSVFKQMFDSGLRKTYCDIGEVFFKWMLVVTRGVK